MGMSEVADIYFEKLTPEVVLNSLIWLDSNVSILGEYYQSPLKLKKKHKFKVTVGNKTIEGGNPKGKLIAIKISSKAIKLAKEHEKGKNKDKIREEYLKEYKKNFGSDLHHYSLCPLPLFSESFSWHFTKEKIDKERKKNSFDIDKAFPEYCALPYEKKRKQVYVSDSQYELEIYLDHICIDPDLNRISLPNISLMKKKLVKLCKLINATKGEFPIEFNYEFYPKDKSHPYTKFQKKQNKIVLEAFKKKKISKLAMNLHLEDIRKRKRKLDLSKYASSDKSELAKYIKKLVKENKDLSHSQLIKIAMKKYFVQERPKPHSFGPSLIKVPKNIGQKGGVVTRKEIALLISKYKNKSKV